MIIATATDRNYVELAGVLLRSICLNGRVRDARLVVLGEGLRSSDKELLARCADRPLTFIDGGDVARELAGIKRPAHWPLATFMRLVAPKYLQTDDNRLLYLDADTLVVGSLAELFLVEMGGSAIAARVDDWNICASRVGLPAGTPYFNSGVMLIDLEAWRTQDISARALAWAEQSDLWLKYADQDVLNAVIGGNFVPLDERWNHMRFHSPASGDSRIIHFVQRKPTYAECESPAQRLFLDVRKQTPWAHKPLISRTSRRLTKRWRRLKSAVRGVVRGFYARG